MLLVLSPAKKLDYDSPVRTTLHSQPQFIPQATALIKVLKKKSVSEIAGLMKLSETLAKLNAERYAAWKPHFDQNNSRQAVLAFNGDVYEGLSAPELSDAKLKWAQDHVALLSGLYGVLRPLDLMQPYRLEMGTKLANPKGANLYQFWGDSITAHLNQYMREQQLSTLLNLASNEYFKSVKPAALEANLVNVDFKDLKNGQYKIISFYAKKARGLMARFVIQNRINSVADLRGFDVDGYRFSESDSSANQLIFLRDTPV